MAGEPAEASRRRAAAIAPTSAGQEGGDTGGCWPRGDTGGCWPRGDTGGCWPRVAVGGPNAASTRSSGVAHAICACGGHGGAGGGSAGGGAWGGGDGGAAELPAATRPVRMGWARSAPARRSASSAYPCADM
eukprot:scaffold27535_cov116-Isochrysis_galbana.AAC.2